MKTTEIICIIDRSGSMGLIVNDAIGGFNTFLENQKQVPSEATLTYVQFNDQIKTVHENLPLSKVPTLTKKTYMPMGTTALLDAIGLTIDRVGKRLANMNPANRPEKVIVAILTDGQENASEKYNRNQVKEMIEHQRQKYSWEFIFLAANQDAFTEAGSLGIDSKDTFNFQATGDGIREAYRNMTNTTTGYRTS